MKKPSANESAQYYHYYINQNKGTDVLGNLEKQISQIKKAFASIPASKQNFRYAKGKWSIKELLGHLNDGERIFGYRALRVARKDLTPLPGFDENLYVKNAHFEKREMKSLLEEFVYLRKANIEMFKTFNAKELALKGTANSSPISVRALAYIISGHTMHHLEILKERYLCKL